jgi:HK97 gp10 family phage protein
MALGMNVVFKLLRKVDNTKAFTKALNDGIFAEIRRAAINIDNRVKTTAPFQTGNLRRSYHFQLFRKEMAGRVGSDPGIAPYAVYVEFGTSKQKAQPHLGPAGEREREPFQERLQTVIDVITRAWSSGKIQA